MVDQLNGVVTNITTCSTLSFSNDEFLEEGKDHNRALHVLVRCKDNSLARVLFDTGSSLNVIPKRTFIKLSFERPTLRPSALVVKAFDGSKRMVFGEVEFPI